MSKILNVVVLVAVAIAFFMLKGEIDKVKNAIDIANNVAVKVQALEDKLSKLNIRFEEESTKNDKFQELTTKYIYNDIKQRNGIE